MNEIQINAGTVEETLKAVNNARKQNKNKWIVIKINSGDSIITIKSFNTSIQIMRKNGLDYGSGWDLSVAEFTKRVKECIEK